MTAPVEVPAWLSIGSRYAVTSDGDKAGVLGEGSFGAVYKGIDIETKAAVAIKLEAVTARYPQLSYEHKALEELAGTRGIPRVLYFGPYTTTHNALVMERLGASVGSFAPLPSPKLVAHVARGLLGVLRYVHRAGIVHRDIKPENLLWEKGTCADTMGSARLFLIDFGLCKRVMEEDGRHIPEREGKSFVGTPEYAALRAHQGRELSRRDDVESMVYVLVYLATKTLPWQRRGAVDDKEIAAAKKRALEDVEGRLLAGIGNDGLRAALLATIIYARTTLRFADMPNFEVLERYWSML